MSRLGFLVLCVALTGPPALSELPAHESRPGLGERSVHVNRGALLLELRVFNGPEEVTSQTRVKLHRAGDRGDAVAQNSPGAFRIEFSVDEGLYDAQAIRESGGDVISIRWANHLVVMKYPDERGRHLEVINFKAGFGALQIRGGAGSQPEVALYPAGNRSKEIPSAAPGQSYTLFVVPAGKYDVFVKGQHSAWHAGIEVPLDRTRLWLVPGGETGQAR